uniref:CDK5RAP1-like protein n=1 Tax=Cacopsylla melanoneura TaxID=428564 RepID=A0A8D8TD75_9HEMI
MLSTTFLKLYQHRSYSVVNHYRKILTNGINSHHFHTRTSTLFNESHSKIHDVSFKEKIENGPSLGEFIRNSPTVEHEHEIQKEELVPYLNQDDFHGQNRKVYFEVFGCQMNVNDIEVVWSILKSNGYTKVNQAREADVILVMTCAIRENAEGKVWERLKSYRSIKQANKKSRTFPLKIGILGCMAERLKKSLLEKEQCLDLVAGPDSYKDLPRLLALTYDNQTAINVMLSLDETYADISPVRLNEDSVSAFVSIMRGCDNMCSYCIVPFTRGRERSRPMQSILDEVKTLSDQGVKEITLLGQNVNSYRDTSVTSHQVAGLGTNSTTTTTPLVDGFKTVYKTKTGGIRFAELLDRVSRIDPEMRVRFTSPHPKDFPDEVLHLIKDRHNICKSLHLPAQSGNNEVLERMRRGYTVEAYLTLVDKIRSLIPGVSLSSDFIAGFCGETEAQFEDTLRLLETVRYRVAYLFAYSMREKTTAHRRYQDTVPTLVKNQRVQQMDITFRRHASLLNSQTVGSVQLVLVEGPSKKVASQLCGRIDGNIKVNFPANQEALIGYDETGSRPIRRGDYVAMLVTESTSQAMRGVPLYHTTSRGYDERNNEEFMRRNEERVKQ